MVSRSAVSGVLLWVLGACGGNPAPVATERQPPPEAVITSARVTHLSIPEGLTSIHVGEPLTIGVAVTASGPAHTTSLHVGLMEVPPANATDEQMATLSHCTLAEVELIFRGGTDEVAHATAQAHIPSDCLPDAAERTFSLWTSLDSHDRIHETGDDAGGDDIVVFNAKEISATENQACRSHDQDPNSAGCVYSLLVKPNDRVNLVFTELEPSSSVAVLHPEADHPHVPTGRDEYNVPLIKMKSTVMLYGPEPRDDDGDFKPDSDNHVPQGSYLTYSIRPRDLTDAERGLTIHADGDSHQGHQTTAPVGAMIAGSPVHMTHELYAEGETYDALSTGGAWENQTHFVIKACVHTEAAEHEATGGRGDNCQDVNVVLVRSTTSGSGASQYALNAQFNNEYGSSKTVGVSLENSTENVLNLSGASSRTRKSVKVHSIIGTVPVYEASADADALVAITGSGVDLGAKVFGVNVYSYSRRAPAFSYARTFEVARSYCGTFRYGVVVMTLSVQMCFTGKGGLNSTLDIKAEEAAGAAPFDAATKIGVATATVTPFTDFSGSVTASADITVARAGATGSMTLVKASLPLVADLRWGLVAGPKLVITSDAQWQAVITTLDGEIDLFADTREVKICKKWRIKYPCGFRWDRVFSLRLASWSGYSSTKKLLNRQGPQLTLE